jgi:chorismate synthase
MPDAAPGDGIVLRRVETPTKYKTCVALEHETWGAQFTEIVPSAILMVSQKIGGVTAGAFDRDGRLLGFVFGMTGVQDGRLVHWSDLLAVRPEARDHGLGRRLKFYQRDLLLPLGVQVMYWTFDPLVAKNAHLNLNRLGARASEYVVDMYGGQTGSALHGGLGTDRFIVEWQLAAGGGAPSGHSSGMPPAASVADLAAPLVNPPGPDGVPVYASFPDVSRVRVEIPADIHALQRDRIAVAREWRATTRAAITHYLARGYHISGLRGDGANRRWYVLERPDR